MEGEGEPPYVLLRREEKRMPSNAMLKPAIDNTRKVYTNPFM